MGGRLNAITTQRHSGLIILLIVFLLTAIGDIPVKAENLTVNNVLSDPAQTVIGNADSSVGLHSFENDSLHVDNFSNTIIDIPGWALVRELGVRNLFPAGKNLAPYSVIVLFGDGMLLQRSRRLGNDIDGELVFNVSGDTETTSPASVVDPAESTISAAAEDRDDSGRPEDTLLTTAVPIPGALILLVSGLTVFVGVKRKKQIL